MNRKGWPVSPRRLLCAVGMAALLAGCGSGRDSDTRAGAVAGSGKDSSLLGKARDLTFQQVCKRTSACDDEESRETIKALGEVLEQRPEEARRQLAEADMHATDNKVDNMPGVTGAGMAGLMEMARSMLEADAGQRPTSSDAVATETIGPDVTGPELVARLDGIPVKTGALTPAEFRSRITAIPAED